MRYIFASLFASMLVSCAGKTAYQRTVDVSVYSYRLGCLDQGGEKQMCKNKAYQFGEELRR